MNKDNDTNFWISYADLMAGLLFVFILLIGAIITKYSLLESESKVLERVLKKEKIELDKSKKEILLKEKKITNIIIDLEKTKTILNKTTGELKYNKNIVKEALIRNRKLKTFLLNNKYKLEEQQIQLTSKDKKIKEYLLLQKEFESKVATQEKQNLNLKEKLHLASVVLEEKKKSLDELLNDIVEKKNLIISFEQTNDELNDEIKALAQKLKVSTQKHKEFSKDLLATKTKIKNLTGIKIKVISQLKKSLGKDMLIDPKNGSIRLSSNVLFEEGQDKLKKEAKKVLEKSVYNYFSAILENDEINKHIDKIVIEGHTNSKGSFLYNLDLSQKRAYSVMDFLFSLGFKEKEKLKNLVVASGRSFLDPIFDKNNKEDLDASRRIEIRFTLKNEEAIKEIEAILDKKK